MKYFLPGIQLVQALFAFELWIDSHGTSNIIELGSPEWLTEGDICGNIEYLLLCDRLGSLGRIDLGTDVGNEIG